MYEVFVALGIGLILLIIYSTTQVSTSDYLTSVARMHGIEIDSIGEILEISLPCLLPKRKKQNGTEFLLEPFHVVLEKYARNHAMPHIEHCVICFAHIYKWDTPERCFRDYDNLELKQYLDIAASYILTDNSGLLCDAYNTTELGDEDCLCIYIMESDWFPEWLKVRKNTLQAIHDL